MVCRAATIRERAKGILRANLGKEHIRGGTAKHKKNRLLALERLRNESELTPDELGRWEHFATTWDTRMAEKHKADWGKLFLAILQDLWIRTAHNGGTYALSVHMMAHERDTIA